MPDNKEGYSNLEMLKNQANTIAHHAKEFKEAVDKSEDAMPWEVAKAMRASTDLSDITHYREGEADSYAKGGQMDFDIDDFDAPHELAKGGKLEVGRTYRAKDGNSYRYVGGDYFLDAQRNYVKKGRDEFEGYFFEEGGIVEADSVVPGARFKNPSGTVFIVDKVLLEKSSVTGEDTYFVHSSLEGGEKGNYRDPLDEFVAFMNEEKATPVMAGGGEAEEGGFYIYGKTQRDNYDIANMLRELEIQFEWEAAEGRFRIVEDDEYGDLAFRLQVEMDDRPVYGRIEKVIKWGGYAEHGMELEEEDDLFDKWEELPDEVHEVLEEYENEEPNASNVEDMRGRLNALGYDFEYGLDYSPYGLRKMAKGGPVQVYYLEEGDVIIDPKTNKKKKIKKLDKWFAERYVNVYYEDGSWARIGTGGFHPNTVERLETGAKPIMKGGGKTANLRDVFNDLEDKVGELRIYEEGKEGIRADIRHWGDWEHDYMDYERNEEDFEDDDFMKLTNQSYRAMNDIVKGVQQRHPEAWVLWDAGEKNFIDFHISHKDQMAEGGNVKGRYVVKFGFTSDDGEYKVQKSKPIDAESEDDAARKLKDQFESYEGTECSVINVEKLEGGGETDKKLVFRKGDYFVVLKDMGKLKRFRIWSIAGNYVTINYSRYDGTDVYDSNQSKSNLKYLLENGYIKKVNKREYWNRKYENYAEGGPVKFKDKVAAVKKNLLKRKKVPKSVQKDYGKTYSPDEAQESAQRIVGAQTARERLMMRIKKGKKKK